MLRPKKYSSQCMPVAPSSHSFLTSVRLRVFRYFDHRISEWKTRHCYPHVICLYGLLWLQFLLPNYHSNFENKRAFESHEETVWHHKIFFIRILGNYNTSGIRPSCQHIWTNKFQRRTNKQICFSHRHQHSPRTSQPKPERENVSARVRFENTSLYSLFYWLTISWYEEAALSNTICIENNINVAIRCSGNCSSLRLGHDRWTQLATAFSLFHSSLYIYIQLFYFRNIVAHPCQHNEWLWMSLFIITSRWKWRSAWHAIKRTTFAAWAVHIFRFVWPIPTSELLWVRCVTKKKTNNALCVLTCSNIRAFVGTTAINAINW